MASEVKSIDSVNAVNGGSHSLRSHASLLSALALEPLVGEDPMLHATHASRMLSSSRFQKKKKKKVLVFLETRSA